MKKRFLYVLVFSLLVLSMSLPTRDAHATGPLQTMAIDSNARSQFQKSVGENGGSEASTVPQLVINSINLLLYAAGVAAVIVIIIGAIRMATSEGDPAGSTKGRNSVLYALVGLVLAAAAYALVNFVLKAF
jgi:hypothetical protein